MLEYGGSELEVTKILNFQVIKILSDQDFGYYDS